MKIKSLKERKDNKRLTMIISEDQLRRLTNKMFLINEEKGAKIQLFVKERIYN